MVSKQDCEFINKSSSLLENIVAFYGITLDPISIVTAYQSNGSVSSYLKKPENQLNEALTIKWFQGICRGMNHLHEEGVIHRDLAARNLLLDANLTIKISDFGLSVGSFFFSEKKLIFVFQRVVTSNQQTNVTESTGREKKINFKINDSIKYINSSWSNKMDGS